MDRPTTSLPHAGHESATTTQPPVDDGGPAFPLTDDTFKDGMSLRAHLTARNLAAMLSCDNIEYAYAPEFVASDYEEWPSGNESDFGYRLNSQGAFCPCNRKCATWNLDDPFYRRVTTHRTALVREAIAYADETIKQLRNGGVA